ncbi:hypothetical protein CerSpe_209640 [Prunus speciosa]
MADSTKADSSTPPVRSFHDYYSQITPNKLDGSNYSAWSRSVRLAITTHRMASFINGKKTAPAIDDSSYESWDEDNCLVQSWLLNSMTKNVCALFDHCPTACAVWEAAWKTCTVTQNSSKLYRSAVSRLPPLRMVSL